MSSTHFVRYSKTLYGEGNMELESLGPYILLEIAMYDNDVHRWLLRNSRVYALFSTSPSVQALLKKTLMRLVKIIGEADQHVRCYRMIGSRQSGTFDGQPSFYEVYRHCNENIHCVYFFGTQPRTDIDFMQVYVYDDGRVSRRKIVSSAHAAVKYYGSHLSDIDLEYCDIGDRWTVCTPGYNTEYRTTTDLLADEKLRGFLHVYFKWEKNILSLPVPTNWRDWYTNEKDLIFDTSMDV